LYASPNIIRVFKSRRKRWAVHVARVEAMRNAYKIFVGEPEWKRSLGISTCRWEDNIRMDFRGIMGGGGVGCRMDSSGSR
jgi:hypothetical protein